MEPVEPISVMRRMLPGAGGAKSVAGFGAGCAVEGCAVFTLPIMSPVAVPAQ